MASHAYQRPDKTVNLHRLHQQRSAEDKPPRVALIGALRYPVRKGNPVTWGDVAISESGAARVRQEMETLFGIEWGLRPLKK